MVLRGRIENLEEIQELYCAEGERWAGEGNVRWDRRGAAARLLLELYSTGFSDRDGDRSSQPATALHALQGEFAFVIFDSRGENLLVARSAGGEVPLYWAFAPGDGTRGNQGALVLSTERSALVGCRWGRSSQGNYDVLPATEFPQGHFYESLAGGEGAIGQGNILLPPTRLEPFKMHGETPLPTDVEAVTEGCGPMDKAGDELRVPTPQGPPMRGEHSPGRDSADKPQFLGKHAFLSTLPPAIGAKILSEALHGPLGRLPTAAT